MIDRNKTTAVSCIRLPVFPACGAALLALMLLACAGLPALEPIGSSSAAGSGADCSDVFLDDSWRMVHAIEPVISGKQAGVVMGITVVVPADGSVEAVIMTLEGLVLFHARSAGGTIEIQRALAPFDSPHFARGLIEDVTLLFLSPEAVKMISGFTAEGIFTCRYIREDGSLVDVGTVPAGGWKIFEYDRRKNLRRQVTAKPQAGCPSGPDVRLPCRIELKARQRPSYTLKMSLMEAERITEVAP